MTKIVAGVLGRCNFYMVSWSECRNYMGRRLLELYADDYPDAVLLSLAGASARSSTSQYRLQRAAVQQTPFCWPAVALERGTFGRNHEVSNQGFRMGFQGESGAFKVSEVTIDLGFRYRATRFEWRVNLPSSSTVEDLVVLGTVPTRAYRLTAEFPGHFVQASVCTRNNGHSFHVFRPCSAFCTHVFPV